MFDDLKKKNNIKGFLNLLQAVKVVELFSVNIHALINQFWKMAPQSLLKISVRRPDVQNLLTILNRLDHQRKSLPQDLQIPDLGIGTVNLIPVFEEMAP